MPVILGLDPGFGTTGYGLIRTDKSSLTVLEAGVIRGTKPADGEDDLGQRVSHMYDNLCAILDQWQPAVVAVEQLYAHAKHPRTAVLMAHVRGCYFLAAAQRQIATASYASTQVKKALTGFGRADKEQMQAAVMRELSLPKPPTPHDVADALAVALCHHYRSANSIVGNVPTATFTGVNRSKLFGQSQE